MRLAFRIALRFLFTSKGQTLLIALGIAIGISVQIFIGSLIEGLQISLIDTTIGSASHITLVAKEKNQPLDDYEELISAINSSSEESFKGIKHLSPSITRGAFLSLEDNTASVLFRGFELAKADAIYKFSSALLDDSQLPKAGTNEVLIGKGLSEDFDINVGDTLNMITSSNQVKEVTVVGTFDLKVAAINDSWMIGDLSYAKAAFDLEANQSINVEMQVDEPFDADLIAEKLTATLGNPHVIVDNWKAQNEQLLGGLTGQSSSSLLIQVFVVISVVLGIASVLAITVLQKSRQIGILKAMGINDKTSSLVFLFQGFILGIIGGVLGIAIGLGLLVVFTSFALNPDGTPVVPIFINYRFMLLSGGIAIVASTAAAIIPALKSSKLSPIEVIKNG